MIDSFLILTVSVFGVFIGVLVYKNKKYKQTAYYQIKKIHQIRQREIRRIPDLQTLAAP